MGKQADSKKRVHTWRTFPLARAFVHTLGLKNGAEWWDYCKSDKKPFDIPSNPDKVYRSEYKGLGDWLGTGTIASFKHYYRPFSEARAFVHTLGLKSTKEWRRYCTSGEKPDDIPTMPERYGSEFNGYGDWLGTGNIAYAKQVWRPFSEARSYVRSLQLKNYDEWLAYCRSGKKAADIPATPDGVYLAEFEGYGDWLGTSNIAWAKRVWRPFSEARAFVHTLELKNYDQWEMYCTSGKKPTDIPSHPSDVYASDYKDVGDWLGTGRTLHYRPFLDARAFARTLGLKSYKQWTEYCRSGKKPPDIPSYPQQKYRGKYKSIEDWLGTEYLSFSEARAFVQTLHLKNHNDWLNYCKSGKKPLDIPSSPNNVYRSEYKGIKDWLGVVDKWNNSTLLAFLHDLQPQLGYLDRRDLVAILEQDDIFTALRKALGGTTSKRVLNDLMHNEGRELAQALREMQDYPRPLYRSDTTQDENDHFQKREFETFADPESTEPRPQYVRDHVFTCYSHKDKKWLEKLQTMLVPMTRKGKIKVWADTQIESGTEWREEISKALAIAKVAVLLVTPHFLSSDFIAEHELPPLLEAAKKEGLVVLWIAVSPSLYEETELVCYQAANDPSKPLSGLREVKINEELVQICKKIKVALTN